MDYVCLTLVFFNIYLCFVGFNEKFESRNKSIVKFPFIAVFGIFLGIFEGSHGSHRSMPAPGVD